MFEKHSMEIQLRNNLIVEISTIVKSHLLRIRQRLQTMQWPLREANQKTVCISVYCVGEIVAIN